MGNRVNQSTVPTFNYENSLISNMDNNTILFCDSFNGDRKNFIVVDKAAIVANGATTVETAYDNGWIKDFFGGAKNRNYYKWTLKGGDINSFDNFCLYQDVINDPSKFYVTEDGAPFYDWALLSRREMKDFNSDYVSHIWFNNGHDSNAIYEIHYWEDIAEVNSYSLELYRTSGIARNRNIVKTISDQHGSLYYLDDAVVNDEFSVDCTYKDFDGTVPDITIEKTFSDKVYAKQISYQLPVTEGTTPGFLEVWTADRNFIGSRKDGSGNDYSTSNRFASSSIIIKSTDVNEVNIYDIGPGVFKFRIKFDDGTVSNWFDNILEVKKYNVFSTDITVSSKNYRGFVYFSKVK